MVIIYRKVVVNQHILLVNLSKHLLVLSRSACWKACISLWLSELLSLGLSSPPAWHLKLQGNKELHWVIFTAASSIEVCNHEDGCQSSTPRERRAAPLMEAPQRLQGEEEKTRSERGSLLLGWNKQSLTLKLKIGACVSRGFLSDYQGSGNSGDLSLPFSSSHTVESMLQPPPLTILHHLLTYYTGSLVSSTCN